MMHLLCKYDVARFTRNDAIFALSISEAASSASASSLVKRHHLPKANIIEKGHLLFASALFHGGGDGLFYQ